MAFHLASPYPGAYPRCHGREWGGGGGGGGGGGRGSIQHVLHNYFIIITYKSIIEHCLVFENSDTFSYYIIILHLVCYYNYFLSRLVGIIVI